MKFVADAILFHASMLNDRRRTASYLASIRDVVKPGDVVVDIGTGTGVLAIAAVHAGARHVYAIEEARIARVARTLFEANGMTDHITLIRGRSTEVRLPQRADVLISELIGNEPLAERVIGITKDALRRLLKPGARLVPSGLKIFGLPVTIPDTELSRRTFLPEVVQNWQSWYGIELTRLSEVELFSNLVDFVNPYTARLWKSLSPPVLLADVDFKMWRGFGINKTKTVTANASGQLNGLIVYFELMVGPTTLVSTHPSLVGIDNHWRSPVYVFVNPLSLQAGDQFDVIYRYRPVSAVSTCKVRQRRAR